MGKIDSYRVIVPLAVIGIVLALYLLYEYFSPAANSVCYVNSLVNCEASTRGVLAKTLGIPTSLYGLAGYSVILFSALRKMPRLLFITVVFGLAFCLRITYKEIFEIRNICPVCLACQIDMLAIFALILPLVYKKPSTTAS